MRRFVLQRREDSSGVSGLGVVAEGIAFSDGTAVRHWLTAGGSTAVYHSAERVVDVHGHDGRTELLWLDLDPIICRA